MSRGREELYRDGDTGVLEEIGAEGSTMRGTIGFGLGRRLVKKCFCWLIVLSCKGRVMESMASQREARSRQNDDRWLTFSEMEWGKCVRQLVAVASCMWTLWREGG